MQAEGAGTAGAVCTQDHGKALGRACSYGLIVSLVACFPFYFLAFDDAPCIGISLF
jgi:hypothetical protein